MRCRSVCLRRLELLERDPSFPSMKTAGPIRSIAAVRRGTKTLRRVLLPRQLQIDGAQLHKALADEDQKPKDLKESSDRVLSFVTGCERAVAPSPRFELLIPNDLKYSWNHEK